MNTTLLDLDRRSIETTARELPLADLAVEALIDEVELTPKPALVDGRSSGAHKDLTLDSMRRSAWSLHPTFLSLALCARGRGATRELREELAAIGRAGEPAMMAATGGGNAHRGAIWAVGLLVAASAMLPKGRAADIAQLAGEIARLPDRFIPAAPSHGQRMAANYGVPGARGEAVAGFPHVIEIGLPALQARRAAGIGETHARLDSLMSIMERLDDTCVLFRGGLAALDVAKQGASRVLQAGGSATEDGMTRLLALHTDLMALNASPGGAADMLAATLFLDRVDSDVAIKPATDGDILWKF
ncbi:triphosphoribosyl-dephospho-CoA synthase [Rhizobium sp.]|jgi:triphosphoribosyl-dephospho-CoA synthase|uniref:triphosphoribosyl-dephospho-CoA synthase n=1 Tax=Rhizobium sp. TaxID=391 RepID=UPI000E9AFC9E|nr:triphosphoribosyl-dephospho-CoA synthase MdcB [Rhizobium sp.]